MSRVNRPPAFCSRPIAQLADNASTGNLLRPYPRLVHFPRKMSNEQDIPEDQLVWSFFDNKTTGFFVDVGANHPYNWSQTWLLEKNGWRGILIEPQEAYYELLRQERKNSVVWRAACSSPRKRGEAFLYRPNDNPGVATLQKNADDPDIRYDCSEKVQVVTLDEILIKAGRPSIDLLSLDVEGTELEVLEGFDLARYRPKLILIEDKCQSPRKHFYLRRAGYRFTRRTGFNNWYVPKEDPKCRIRLDQRVEFLRKMYLALPFRRFQRFRAWLRSR
jgi:FkbM family methyltransferase